MAYQIWKEKDITELEVVEAIQNECSGKGKKKELRPGGLEDYKWYNIIYVYWRKPKPRPKLLSSPFYPQYQAENLDYGRTE